MSNPVLKNPQRLNVRLSDEGWHLLQSVTEATGLNQTDVTEMCYALHCVMLNIETKRARQFFFEQCMKALVARERMLRRAGRRKQVNLKPVHTYA